MADFNECIDFVLKHEGGLFKDSATGEYSNFGITQKLLLGINYFVKDPKDLTISDAKNIYQQQFWQKYRLDLFTSNLVARKILDMAVNMGPRQAALCVQDALGLEGHMRDGVLGHFTRAEINEWPEDRMLLKLSESCRDFYIKIAEKNLEQTKYLSGWLRRAGDV